MLKNVNFPLENYFLKENGWKGCFGEYISYLKRNKNPLTSN
jgi:hypothetical protein